MIVTANSTCVLLARENMTTQRINTHLAGAKCAIVRMGKQLGDGRSETIVGIPRTWGGGATLFFFNLKVFIKE